jgi:hypothetical protein
MAARKKKKAAKSAKKAKKTAVKKKAKKVVRKAAGRKSVKRKAAAAPKKAVKKKAKKTAKRAAKAEIGEGNYKASRRFRKSEEAFVKANKGKIEAMGKAAEAALEGPEGADLMAAEAEAASHAAGKE